MSLFLFCATMNAELASLMSSRLFYWPIFSCPLLDSDQTKLTSYGSISNILEDLPQIIIQGSVVFGASDALRVSQNAQDVTLISFSLSAFALLYGLFSRYVAYSNNAFQKQRRKRQLEELEQVELGVPPVAKEKEEMSARERDLPGATWRETKQGGHRQTVVRIAWTRLRCATSPPRLLCSRHCPRLLCQA